MRLYLHNICELYGNVPVTLSDVLAADIIENLQSAMDSFNELMAALRK